MRKKIAKFLVVIMMLVMTGTATSATAGVEDNVTGAGGYDLVSYRTGEKPLPGNENHLSDVDGVTCLFVSKDNKKAFDKNPEKFLPVFGGYCADGVAVGKKFVGDPNVWEIVDGQLYLNLDNKIKGSWVKDIPGYIRTANEEWPKIRVQHFSAL